MSETPKIQRDYPPRRSSGAWTGFGLGLAAGVLLAGSYLLFEFHGPTNAQTYFGSWTGGIWDMVTSIGSKHRGLTLDQLRYRILSEGNPHHKYDGDLKAYGYPVVPLRTSYWPAPIEGGILFFLLVIPVVLGWVIGLFRDSEYERKLREGVHLSGAREIDMPTYRKHNKGDGLTFILKPREGNRRTHDL